MAAKRKDMSPSTSEQENGVGQMLPPRLVMRIEDKVAFITVPKLTSMEVSGMGIVEGSCFTMAKFLPFGRRMRAVDAHAIFDEHFKEYGKEAKRREKDITPMDIQLGRDSVWVEKVIRHLMFSLDVAAEVGPPLISPEMAEDMFWADLESVRPPRPPSHTPQPTFSSHALLAHRRLVVCTDFSTRSAST